MELCAVCSSDLPVLQTTTIVCICLSIALPIRRPLSFGLRMSRFTVYAMFVLLLCTSPAFAAYNGTCIDASSFGNLTFCDVSFFFSACMTPSKSSIIVLFILELSAEDSYIFTFLAFQMVDYSVYLAPGETIYGLDRLAQQVLVLDIFYCDLIELIDFCLKMFFSKEYGTGGCETQARVLICSNVLRRYLFCSSAKI